MILYQIMSEGHILLSDFCTSSQKLGDNVLYLVLSDVAVNIWDDFCPSDITFLQTQYGCL